MEFEEWRDCQIVREQAYMAAEAVGEAVKNQLPVGLLTLQSSCDSPIEAVFLMWWVAIKRLFYIVCIPILDRSAWKLIPQTHVTVGGANYRLDFEVAHENTTWTSKVREAWPDMPRIAVELDGHDFHERTPEQVELRNTRDRALQAAGWHVFHFSGRELLKAPAVSVVEVLTFCQELWATANKRAGLETKSGE
jgi:hypothetical protein